MKQGGGSRSKPTDQRDRPARFRRTKIRERPRLESSPISPWREARMLRVRRVESNLDLQSESSQSSPIVRLGSSVAAGEGARVVGRVPICRESTLSLTLDVAESPLCCPNSEERAQGGSVNDDVHTVLTLAPSLAAICYHLAWLLTTAIAPPAAGVCVVLAGAQIAIREGKTLRSSWPRNELHLTLVTGILRPWLLDNGKSNTDDRNVMITLFLPTSRSSVGWCTTDLGCGRLSVRIPDKSGAGMRGRGQTGNPQENQPPAASSGTIPLANRTPFALAGVKWSDHYTTAAPATFILDEPGSIHGGATPVFSHVAIVAEDATGRRVLSGLSLSTPFIPALLYSHLNQSHVLAAKSRPNLFTDFITHYFPHWSATCEKRAIPGKTRRPATSSGMIPTCENPGATPPGIESGSPWREASSLTVTPPRLHLISRSVFKRCNTTPSRTHSRITPRLKAWIRTLGLTAACPAGPLHTRPLCNGSQSLVSSATHGRSLHYSRALTAPQTRVGIATHSYNAVKRQLQQCVLKLLSMIEESIRKEDTVMREAIPSDQRLALTLRQAAGCEATKRVNSRRPAHWPAGEGSHWDSSSKRRTTCARQDEMAWRFPLCGYTHSLIGYAMLWERALRLIGCCMLRKVRYWLGCRLESWLQGADWRTVLTCTAGVQAAVHRRILRRGPEQRSPDSCDTQSPFVRLEGCKSVSLKEILRRTSAVRCTRLRQAWERIRRRRGGRWESSARYAENENLLQVRPRHSTLLSESTLFLADDTVSSTVGHYGVSQSLPVAYMLFRVLTAPDNFPRSLQNGPVSKQFDRTTTLLPEVQLFALSHTRIYPLFNVFPAVITQGVEYTGAILAVLSNRKRGASG
ncbi:hypothetical protein PR048_028003 [Dryococelus australis]|uniref:Uncharacterized protein n=1 Tax=Dryococelus australis TaxID=614101 RepID=A0ABQ9GI48_9NEOP|nr:hypothetical protein PR048_028003 [Dryococelus australis]